ncbi:MAG: hypothetical protein K9J06_01245 [Flavobacteriales bacterium]|nr:hypothetical protein [Flavobacteriales bacterium]
MEWAADFLASPLGDGQTAGDHNITIFRQNNVAILQHVKSNGPGVEPEVIQEIDLSNTTARIRIVDGNVVTQVYGAGHQHNSTLHYIAHSSYADMKITTSCPLASGVAAIVGMEDPRAGVQGYRGDINVYALPLGTSHIRVSQGSSTTLRVSYYSDCTHHEYIDKEYCNEKDESTTGVKLWGRTFSKSCE